MPELTRRRSLDHRNECWHVYYGDVHAGTIVIRSGNPHDTDPWEWRCGFYPGSHPREHQSGTAATFDEARADFEGAWKIFLSKRTEADFQAWRDDRDWTARKYALWDAGKKLEPPSYGPGKPAHRFRRCRCGEVFDMHRIEENLVHVPHISAGRAEALILAHEPALRTPVPVEEKIQPDRSKKSERGPYDIPNGAPFPLTFQIS